MAAPDAPTADLPTLVLASGSPRRRELLTGLGLDPVVRPVDVDESPLPGEAPEAYVQRLAEDKALARGEPGEVVLAADTVVALPAEGEPGARLLGKPEDEADARRMLRRLEGRRHEVHTGVAVWDPGADQRRIDVATSGVRFAPLTEGEISWYAATGEPLDKAGAYAIQGLGALFVEELQGNYSNVVGLPLPLVYRLFRELGWDLRAFRSSPDPRPGFAPSPGPRRRSAR